MSSKHLEKLLDQALKEYEEKENIIERALDFCYRYMSLNLECFDTYKLLEKLTDILEGKENERNN